MTNYLKRLIYIDSEEKLRINPLIWPFFWATFFYGVGFTIFGNWSGVHKSSLYASFAEVGDKMPFVWGVIAMAASISAVAMALLRRYESLGSIAAWFGTLTWIYAGLVYAENGFWLPVVTVAIPNLWFWILYYLKLRWYMKQKELGLLTDAG